MLNVTKYNLDLASSYWTLRGKDVYEHPSDWQGEWIFQHLEEGNSIFILARDIQKEVKVDKAR